MEPQFGPEVTLDQPALIHPTALAFGKVHIAQGASLWPYSVIRAEIHQVTVGRYSNIQDFAMLHIALEHPTVVGDYCSITHHCTLHGCSVGDNCLIGINSTIMNGAKVGDNCIVAGGSLIPENAVIPPNSVVMGTPGKVVATRNNFIPNRFNAIIYHKNALAYAQGEHRAWAGADYEAFKEQELTKLQEKFARRYPQDAP